MPVKTVRTIIIADAPDRLPQLEREVGSTRQVGSTRLTCLTEVLSTLQERRVDLLVLGAALLAGEPGYISIMSKIQKDTAIIVCTDTNSPEIERSIRKQGISFYHVKSLGSGVLEAAVSCVLDREPADDAARLG